MFETKTETLWKFGCVQSLCMKILSSFCVSFMKLQSSSLKLCRTFLRSRIHWLAVQNGFLGLWHDAIFCWLKYLYESEWWYVHGSKCTSKVRTYVLLCCELMMQDTSWECEQLCGEQCTLPCYSCEIASQYWIWINLDLDSQAYRQCQHWFKIVRKRQLLLADDLICVMHIIYNSWL